MKYDTTRLKQELDLVAFCARNGFQGYKKVGSGAMFYSPFRSESEQSFQVSYYRGAWNWKDWGSGEGGDVISLVQAMHGCDFKEACRMIYENDLGEYRHPRHHPPASSKDEADQKVKWLKETYISLLKRPVLEKVKKYFSNKSVRYYPAMGAVMYRDKENINYVAIPLPNPFEIKGLECRGYDEHKRKTLGHKELWVLKRDPKRVLVTESILDALAGEEILGMQTATLVSINGATNASKFVELYDKVKEKPKEILLALDNDEPGERARQEIENVLRWKWCRVKTVHNHVRAGVKDMHRLLTANH